MQVSVVLLPILHETDLDYTIMCPGGLTDDPGTGLVQVSQDCDGHGLTSRENLAEVLVRCLDLDNTIGKCFSLLEGATRIDEALANV